MSYRLIGILLAGQCLLLAARDQVSDQSSGTLKLKYELSATQVSLHEPIFLTLSITNDGNTKFSIDLGQDRKQAIQLSITPPKGAVVSASLPIHGGVARWGVINIDPGRTYEQTVALDQWYPFDGPGQYKISVRIMPTPPGPISLQTWVALPIVTILPEDPQRLTKACVELRDRIESTTSFDDEKEAALALTYVNDPIAVPYLQEVAMLRGGMLAPVVVKGLAKIDENAGTAALISLAGQQNNIVRAVARSALAEVLREAKDPSVRDQIKQVLEKQ